MGYRYISNKVQAEHKRTLHFKMIQKTNVACLELHTHASR